MCLSRLIELNTESGEFYNLKIYTLKGIRISYPQICHFGIGSLSVKEYGESTDARRVIYLYLPESRT